jgi:hypothetical protein
MKLLPNEMQSQLSTIVLAMQTKFGDADIVRRQRRFLRRTLHRRASLFYSYVCHWYATGRVDSKIHDRCT